MSEVFISYARSNERVAEQVADALRDLGYGVWRDDQLPAHRAYSEVIEERLRAAKAVVVIWSAEAVKSQWVRAEADVARAAGTLVQARLDGAALPLPFNQIQCADLTGWNGDVDAPGWRKLAGSVADLAGGDAPAGVAPPTSRAAPRRVSICVLPFANMSDEPEQAYFSDGISEDITTDLSKVSALLVVSRNTAFTFKGKSIDVRQVARDLGVTHVLEGSVRKAGGRVRVTAQLIAGASDSHIWAERYDRVLTDIFAIQDEISQAIVAALKLKLLPDEKRAIEKRGTTSAEAYDLYLMARQYKEAGASSDPRRYETIIRLCERAIEIDSAYARAWELLASAQMTLVYAFGREGDGGAAAAERALELDPNLAEAHSLVARELYRAGRRDEAAAELDLALRLDPHSYDVNYRVGSFHYRERRFAEAIRYLSRAAALSTTDVASAGMLQSGYAALGDADGARRAAQMTLERAENAVAQDRGNGAAMAYGVLALATLGEATRARDWIDRALLLDPDNLNMRYNFACALSLQLHDADGAIDLLTSVFAKDPVGDYLGKARTDPDFDSIRRHPRFEATMAEAEARLAKATDKRA